MFFLYVFALSLGGALLAIVPRVILQKGEGRLVRRLEDRIAELERRSAELSTDLDAG